MKYRQLTGFILLSGVLLLGMGCASQAPTIAHVHIGHVVDGWETTPDQAGLIVTAENFAQTAYEAAGRAAQTDTTLESRKRDVELLVDATYLEYLSKKKNSGDGNIQTVEFDVRTAMIKATRHIEFSASSDDSSANVRTGARQFSINSQAVIDRCDLIAALGSDTLGVDSAEQANMLTAELVNLTRANLYGEDLNGDGVIGGQNPDEYGIEQLRVEIQNMIARENPPYSTVEKWYLFNLVRLENGKWIFRKNTSGKKGAGY